MALTLIGGMAILTSPGELPPEAVLIRTDRSLGTFAATGVAVDSGRMCSEGFFFDQRPTPGLGSGLPDGSSVEARLVCADGSLDFTIRGEVVKRNPLFKQDEGVWSVVRLRDTEANLEAEGRFLARRDTLGQRILSVTYNGEVSLSQ